MMFDYTGNEDAGDLAAMGYADYCGEMAEQAEHERSLAFTKAFDASVKPGMFPCVETERMGIQADTRHGRIVAGPVEAPHCEGCSKVLTRDGEGVYDEEWGLFYCSEDCFEEHGMHNSASGDYREFPTYG